MAFNDKVCVVYFHGNDWAGVPGRQRLLMEALSRYVRVIFLDGGRDRRLRVTQFQPSANVVVVRGLASILISLAQRGWNFLARFVARRVLRKLTRGSEQVIYWGAENWYDLHRFVEHDLFVHDSIDPCFLEEQVAQFAEREAALARAADVVFCTAESLLADARSVNSHSYLVPNACSVADFEAEERPLDPPAEIRGRPRPYVGYIGTLDSRLALPHLLHAARQLSEYTFVFVGPVLKEQEARLQPLRNLPNVVFPGPKFGPDAAAFAQAFDVCLIPFSGGRAGDALNPVKLYTYLASGKSVVTTSIHECLRHQSLVRVAQTPAEFCEAIQEAIERPDPSARGRGIAFARENMWEHRAATAMEILSKSGLVGGIDSEEIKSPRNAAPVLTESSVTV